MLNAEKWCLNLFETSFITSWICGYFLYIENVLNIILLKTSFICYECMKNMLKTSLIHYECMKNEHVENIFYLL